ncbi:hypothetical protein [Rhizobium sp. MHM7A]|uniref:hypothetical protein n=1 Tax=Rhizobium sp. MHM7A TaxID=2583233 RepID=UPI001105E9D0|nr:hypothetical protein [Rhizobium sp. MHM7A]TLX16752.1 hypothetical protein FFR93_05255 [Rhizobium sp. MHM7A]
MPISIVDDEGFTWVVLDGPVADDIFVPRLVIELLSLARPYGAGVAQAEREKARPLDEIVASAVSSARIPLYGSPRKHDVQYIFDYISGHRVKVRYLPQGLLPDHNRLALRQYDGKPILESNTFDEMYGNGALLNAVNLALL